MNVLHICGKHWYLRGPGDDDLKVYANADNITLTVNGRNCGIRRNGRDYQIDDQAIKHVFYWEKVLTPGRSVITASDGRNEDSCTIYYAPADANMPEYLLLSTRSRVLKYAPRVLLGRVVKLSISSFLYREWLKRGILHQLTSIPIRLPQARRVWFRPSDPWSPGSRNEKCCG